MAEFVLEKNPSDGVETSNAEETRGRISEWKKDATKRDKARASLDLRNPYTMKEPNETTLKNVLRP